MILATPLPPCRHYFAIAATFSLILISFHFQAFIDISLAAAISFSLPGFRHISLCRFSRC